MFNIGNKVKFVVVLPIGESGVCEGIIEKILPPRGDFEGPAYIVGQVKERDVGPAPDYRIETTPSGVVTEDTIIIGDEMKTTLELLVEAARLGRLDFAVKQVEKELDQAQNNSDTEGQARPPYDPDYGDMVLYMCPECKEKEVVQPGHFQCGTYISR